MDLPEFLKVDFIFYRYEKINVKNLYASLIKKSGNVKFCTIYETPHYIFVRHFLYGENTYVISDYDSYQDYESTNIKACNEHEFIQLIKSIEINGYDWENNPILVHRNWKRLVPLGRWDIADGFHRLAILTALGENDIMVGTLRYKNNILKRLLNRFKKYLY